MCGIGGYSLHPASEIDRTLAAQALLAGIAERGSDAAGCAARCARGTLTVDKTRAGASALLDRLDVPTDATDALVHVRASTKGHPRVPTNNHPVRHASVVGIHNVTITNDDDVLATLGRVRRHPETTVDSEAIFALAYAARSDARAFEALRGSLAAAWVDLREPRVLHVARGGGRPLWVARSPGAVFFASTRSALALLARTLRIRLHAGRVAHGLALAFADGRILWRQRFAPDTCAEDEEVDAVHARAEAGRCRHMLALRAAEAR